MKAETVEGLYDNCDTKEGHKDIHRIAVARDRAANDIGHMITCNQECNGRSIDERCGNYETMWEILQMANTW